MDFQHLDTLNDTLQCQILTAQASCVLLVEDDPLARERLELLIAAAGFGVFSVASCKEARDAAAAVVFPIMVIDRMLGDGDGIELIADLRRQCSPNRVFMMLLSALDTEADIAGGLAAGADDYLSKRGSDENLLDRLRAAIRTIKFQVK